MHGLYMIARTSLYCIDRNCALFETSGNIILGKTKFYINI